MQIACPQCSMQYALDTRLLPSGGVPVQCTRCGHVFIAATPAQATPARPAAPNGNPNLNSTLIFGTSKSPTQPSASGTQVFGALPQLPQVPSVAPVANKPQAGGPSISTGTQVFGALPRVPPANKPQAPAPSTAQLPAPGSEQPGPSAGPRTQPVRQQPSATSTPPLGSGPQGAPVTRPQAAAGPLQTTQVFGAVPQPPSGQAPAGTPPSASTTQVFGSAPVPGAQPPGLMPRAQEPVLPARPAPEPVVAVAATTPIELPEEILEQLNRPLAELMAEQKSSDTSPSASPPQPRELPSLSGPSGPGPSKPLELPQGLLEDVAHNANKGRGGQRPETGLRGRGVLIAAGVLVLGLTAFLTSPAWRTRSNSLPHEALVAKEEAVALLRRDDVASKEDALVRLRTLTASYPDSAEILAEVGIAIALHLDDTHVQLSTLQQNVKWLKERISTLSEEKSPADWQSRANTMRDELAAAQRELTPLEERGTRLAKDAVQVSKQLEVVPEKESKEASLARLRARAMLSAALGSNEALALAMQLAQVEQRDWSSLVLAEYVLNTPAASPTQVSEVAAALERMREKDSTFLRTYVLEARIALMRQQPGAALALLDTVLTLNPKHEVAQKLQAYAQELLRQQSEPKPTPAPSLEATPSP